MYIKNFSEISKNDTNLVGGKAAALGELTNSDFPVPPGFVITTEGFQKDVEEEALKAFDNLNADKVAVRSSAVAEDSLQASWAGQLETYLNVSRDDLVNRIKECWESILSDRALSYAEGQDLSDDQLVVAVVIQKMVDSQAAGVMFTVNPVSQDRSEIMIESILGLGEALVQGSVTPDNFLIDKESMEIKSKDIQEIEGQSVSDENIQELVKLGKSIEEHYKSPQDIEWTIDKEGKIWILQSRPITTL